MPRVCIGYILITFKLARQLDALKANKNYLKLVSRHFMEFDVNLDDVRDDVLSRL